jgi:signal peptidase II
MQAARGTPLTASEPSDPQGRGGVRPKTVFVAVALGAYAVDVTTKVLAVRHLTPGEDVPVLGDLLQLSLTRNGGAAFSTGTEFTYALSALALAAIVVVIHLSRRLGSTGWAVALGLLLAGVGGNFTDRVFRAPGVMQGRVVDFLRLPHWPIFNVADICIDVAAALILVQAVRGIGIDGRRHGASGAEEDATPENGGRP